MAVKLNSEFNYRFQVEGNTPWEKIKQLKGFYEGRINVRDSQKSSEKYHEALIKEIQYLKNTSAPEHDILRKEADLIQLEASQKIEKHALELNLLEIKILENILAELYEIVEPTRAVHEDGTPYTDEEMFELNAANEFTAMIGKEIYAEIAAVGHPSPARVRNAMSNPYTLQALKKCGLLPEQLEYLEPNADPLKIELNQTIFNKELPPPKILKLK